MYNRKGVNHKYSVNYKLETVQNCVHNNKNDYKDKYKKKPEYNKQEGQRQQLIEIPHRDLSQYMY